MKGGWVAVLLDDGVFAGAQLLREVETDFNELGRVDVIAVDIPIGFGPRAADAAARALLNGATSTVFTTPTRESLERPFGPGLGVSAQAHALGRRILHVTGLASREPRLREVHPEVSFRAMGGGAPLPRKKSAAGALVRVELLRRNGIELGELGSAATAPLDDVLDAAAAAWTATRIQRGNARSLPDSPDTVDGLRVAIWY